MKCCRVVLRSLKREHEEGLSQVACGKLAGRSVGMSILSDRTDAIDALRPGTQEDLSDLSRDSIRTKVAVYYRAGYDAAPQLLACINILIALHVFNQILFERGERRGLEYDDKGYYIPPYEDAFCLGFVMLYGAHCLIARREPGNDRMTRSLVGICAAMFPVINYPFSACTQKFIRRCTRGSLSSEM